MIILLMKKLLVSISFLLVFFLSTHQVTAQTPTSQPPTDLIDQYTEDEELDSFVTDPPQVATEERPDYYINDFTPTVTVSFPGIGDTYSDSEIYVCLRNDFCIVDSLIRSLAPDKIDKQLKSGIHKKNLWEKYLDASKGKLTNHSIKVCGSGKDKLKLKCDPNKDYFFGGSFYIVTLYIKQDDNFNAIARGGFYVNHGLPKIELTPQENLLPGAKFTLTISQDKFRAGKNEEQIKKRNNYQIVLRGPGINKDACDWVTPDKPIRTFRFPQPKEADNNHYTDADSQELLTSGYTAPGRYTFHINEQDNEGDDKCAGGFHLATITCTIGPGTKANTNRCQKMVVDPKKEDAKELLDLLNVINGASKGVPLPCREGKSVTNPLDCNRIDTAIGPIELNPVGFISRIFSIILSLAGAGALFLIIFSGYRLLVSRGNKEIIQGARETLTAAVVGLIFIVLSLVILSVIAGDILKIPGFG